MVKNSMKDDETSFSILKVVLDFFSKFSTWKIFSLFAMACFPMFILERIAEEADPSGTLSQILFGIAVFAIFFGLKLLWDRLIEYADREENYSKN